MQRGFSHPVLIILILALAIGLLGYYGFDFLDKSHDDVKGVSVIQHSSSGLSVLLTSPGTWDLYEYLCSDLTECLASPISGRRYASISGGAVSRHEIIVPYSKDWQDYEYLKMYVRSGWGSTAGKFSLETYGEKEGFVIEELSDGIESVAVLLVPTSSVEKEFAEEAGFFLSN